MSYTVTGTATRVHFNDARRHFEAGGEVLVSEHGEQLVFDVTASTTTHTKESTAWADLVEQVRMWKGRYPNQRYYVVTRPEPEAVDNEGHAEGAAHTIGTRGDAAGTEVCARCDVEWPCDFAADPTPAEDLDEYVRVVLDVLSEAATDVGEHFTCTEAETIADLYRAMGDTDGAAHWLDAHGIGDDEGDDHYQGDDADDDQPSGHDAGACDPTTCVDPSHLFDGFRKEALGAVLDVVAANEAAADADQEDDPIPVDAERGAASLIREGDTVIVFVAAGPFGNGFHSGTVTETIPTDHYGSPALIVSLDDGDGTHARHIVMETAVTYWLDYHDARPDDDNEPGDRCKDCGRDVTWIGPSHTDWQHVAEQDAALYADTGWEELRPASECGICHENRPAVVHGIDPESGTYGVCALCHRAPAVDFPDADTVAAAGLDPTLMENQGSGPDGVFTWQDVTLYLFAKANQ